MSDEALATLVEAAARRGAEAAIAARDAQRETSRRSFYTGLKQHVIAPALAFLDRCHGIEKDKRVEQEPRS